MSHATRPLEIKSDRDVITAEYENRAARFSADLTMNRPWSFDNGALAG